MTCNEPAGQIYMVGAETTGSEGVHPAGKTQEGNSEHRIASHERHKNQKETATEESWGKYNISMIFL